ncbi:hypothetical protein BGY98DRAFT_643753 [Russula aff. rugulosa BPL654]|nr:hypothetical protein BGY98DRAFT_643753 [Russula aff. rugulosa BPL654]
MSSMPRGRTTGRDISGGLPSNPRARSTGHRDVRERENKDRTRDNGYYPNHNTGTSTRAPPTRSVRPQRSVANIMPSRGESPRSSYNDMPEVPPLPLPRRSDASYQSGTSSGSYSSASGSSSTFLDRMKNRREYGYGSSRTSLEEEDPPPKTMGAERGGWFSQRNPATPEPEYDLGETDDLNELPVEPGYGLSLWSRVATAASTLTISVSKAWESNIVAYSGEQTPPGKESRLTRALKAYHIEKARDPTDLPPWLFEEHERRPLGHSETSLRRREESGYDYDSRSAREPSRTSGRSLRGIYDAAATDTGIPSRHQEIREGSRARPREDATVGAPSKANDRLKALRDAKRNAAQRNASNRPSRPTDEEWPVREERRRRNGSDHRVDGEGHGIVHRHHRLAPDHFTGVGYLHDQACESFSTLS